MTDILDAYRARHSGASPGGQDIADVVAAMPEEQYQQAYEGAYLAKYGQKPPQTVVTSPPAEQETNTPGRIAASVGEGVLRSVWELGRTTREMADFITSNSPLINESDMMTSGIGPDDLAKSGANVSDPGPMPDIVKNKSGVETFTSAVSQYMAPFMAFSKAMSGAKLFDAVGKSKVGSSILKGVAASAPVDFAFIDPIENNLFKVAKDLGFEQELSDYFGAGTVEALLPGTEKSSETNLENRLKAVLTNAPLGAVAEGAIAGLGAMAEGAIAGPAKALMLTAKALKSVRQYAGEVGPVGLSAQRGMVAFHGSPHSFEKFDKTKIGTGEGAQVFGHGLYFAENEGVAKRYQKELSRSYYEKDGHIVNYARLRIDAFERIIEAGDEAVKSPGDAEDVFSLLDEWVSDGHKAENYLKEHDVDPTRRKAFSAAVKEFEGIKNIVGNKYDVDIPDDIISNMLHWDTSLIAQAPEIRKAVEPIRAWLGLNKDATGQQIYELLAKKIRYTQKVNESTAWKLAADALGEAGVPGIKYKDGMSRGKESGTSNFVLFDDKNAKILKKNDKPIEEPPKEDKQAAVLDQIMQLIAAQGEKINAMGSKKMAGMTFEIASRDESGRAKTFRVVES